MEKIRPLAAGKVLKSTSGEMRTDSSLKQSALSMNSTFSHFGAKPSSVESQGRRGEREETVIVHLEDRHAERQPVGWTAVRRGR
jgi:hypothetical protein